MKKSVISVGIIVLILVVCAIFYLILGMRIYSKTSVTQIDSINVHTTDVKTLKSKFPIIFKSKNLMNMALEDTSRVISFSIFHKNDNTPISDKDILEKIDQFYYNSYDKLITTLAIILTVASIFIAFFGGVIPYLRSEKAENLLQRITAQYEESKITQKNLEIMVNNSRLIEDRIQLFIDSLKNRAHEIRRKIVIKTDNIDEIIQFTDLTKLQLQKYYDGTETLLNLGEELSLDDIMIRTIFFIAENMESEYENEFELWKLRDKSNWPYLISGIAFGNNKAIEKSIVQFDEAINHDSTDYRVYFFKGNALLNLGQYYFAIECYNRSIQLKNNFHQAWYNKGNAFSKMKLFKEAVESYNQALLLKPDYGFALYNKGKALRELKQFDEAIIFYDLALQVKPNFYEALINKGIVYSDQKKYDEAINCYDQAIAIAPDDCELYYNKGNAYLNMGQYNEAVKLYDKAICIKPDYLEAWYNKGNSYGFLNQYENAIQSYNEALKIKPDFAAALCNKGFMYSELKQYLIAIEFYESALSYDQHFKDALINEGNAYYFLKQYNKAISYYDRALSIDPNNLEALYNKGKIQEDLGNSDTALDCYNHVSDLNPQDYNIWLAKARLYSKMKDKEKMIAMLRESIRLEINVKTTLMEDASFSDYIDDQDFINLLS